MLKKYILERKDCEAPEESDLSKEFKDAIEKIAMDLMVQEEKFLLKVMDEVGINIEDIVTKEYFFTCGIPIDNFQSFQKKSDYSLYDADMNLIFHIYTKKLWKKGNNICKAFEVIYGDKVFCRSK